jgi:hypothetical protein
MVLWHKKHEKQYQWIANFIFSPHLSAETEFHKIASRTVTDFNDDKPVVAEDFRLAFEERKKRQREAGLLNGWEECDVADCFCKEEPLGQGNHAYLGIIF